jgi:hypothetical protein
MSPYTRFREGQTLSKSPLPNINCPLFRTSGEPQCDSTYRGKRLCGTVEIPDNTLAAAIAAAINDVIYA